MKGLTNVIKFDHQGFRTDFILDIVELNPTGLKLVGNWNSSQGVNFTKTYGEHQKEIVENLKNKTLIVTTILVSENSLLREALNLKATFSECTLLHEEGFGGEAFRERSV